MRQITCKVFLLYAMVCTPFVGACRTESTLSREDVSNETSSDEVFSKDMFVKEKKETFRFSGIGTNATLKLRNDFGWITIVRWDKNEILLERNVSISSSVSGMATKRMESRVVRQKQMGNVYSFVLESSAITGLDDNSIHDDWTVYVPKSRMSFDIHNSFGDTDLYNGIQCNDLKVVNSFGKVRIPDVHVKGRCELNVEYGSLDLGEANKAVVRARFSHVNIDQVGVLDFSVDFGDMTVGRVNRGEGKSSFGKVDIKALVGKMDFSLCQHGKIDVTVADGKSFEGLSINGVHTDVNIYVADNVSARYEMKSKFGSISIKSPSHSTYHQESGVNNSFLSSDKGYIGSDAEAKAQIEVGTSHAGIRVRNR